MFILILCTRIPSIISKDQEENSEKMGGELTFSSNVSRSINHLAIPLKSREAILTRQKYKRRNNAIDTERFFESVQIIWSWIFFKKYVIIKDSTKKNAFMFP